MTDKKRARLIRRLDKIGESIHKAKKYNVNNKAFPILEEILEFLEDSLERGGRHVKTGEDK